MNKLELNLIRRRFLTGMGALSSLGLIGLPGCTRLGPHFRPAHKFLVLLSSSMPQSLTSNVTQRAVGTAVANRILALLSAAARTGDSYRNFATEYSKAYGRDPKIYLSELYNGANRLTPTRDPPLRQALASSWKPDLSWILGAEGIAASYIDPPLGLALSVESLVVPAYVESWNQLVQGIPYGSDGELPTYSHAGISISGIPTSLSSTDLIFRSGLYDVVLNHSDSTISDIARATHIPFDKNDVQLKESLANWGLPHLPSLKEKPSDVANRYLAHIAAHASASASDLKQATQEAAQRRWLTTQVNVNASISLGYFGLKYILGQSHDAETFMRIGRGLSLVYFGLTNPFAITTPLARMQQVSDGAGLILDVISGAPSIAQETLSGIAELMNLLSQIRIEMLEGFAALQERLSWISTQLGYFIRDYHVDYQNLRAELHHLRTQLNVEAEYKGQVDRAKLISNMRKESKWVAINRNRSKLEKFASDALDFGNSTSNDIAYVGVQNIGKHISAAKTFVQNHGFEYSFATINEIYSNEFSQLLWKNPISPFAWAKGGVEAIAALGRLPDSVRVRFSSRCNDWSRLGTNFLVELTKFPHKRLIEKLHRNLAQSVDTRTFQEFICILVNEFLDKNQITNVYPVLSRCKEDRFSLDPKLYSVAEMWENPTNFQAQCPAGTYATIDGDFPLFLDDGAMLMECSPGFHGRRMVGPDVFQMAQPVGLLDLTPVKQWSGPIGACPGQGAPGYISAYKVAIKYGALNEYTSMNTRGTAWDFVIADFNYSDGTHAKIYHVETDSVMHKGTKTMRMTAVDLFEYCRANLYSRNSGMFQNLASTLAERLWDSQVGLAAFEDAATSLKLATIVYLYSIGIPRELLDRKLRSAGYPPLSPQDLGDLISQRMKKGFPADEVQKLEKLRTAVILPAKEKELKPLIAQLEKDGLTAVVGQKMAGTLSKKTQKQDLSNIAPFLAAYLSFSVQETWIEYVNSLWKEGRRKHHIQESLDKMHLFLSQPI